MNRVHTMAFRLLIASFFCVCVLPARIAGANAFVSGVNEAGRT